MSHTTTNRDGRMYRRKSWTDEPRRRDERIGEQADRCAASDERSTRRVLGALAVNEAVKFGDIPNEVVKFGDRTRHPPSGSWRFELPAELPLPGTEPPLPGTERTHRTTPDGAEYTTVAY
jgi:hypothetical protein